jgi:hypothetical protein
MTTLRDPEKIIALATATYMSNAKWRKLIAIIDDSQLQIIESRWEWIGDDRVHTHRGFLTLSDTNETGIEDGRWPPEHFKYIHRITLPRSCKNPRSDPKRSLPNVVQPVDELYAFISEHGQFPLQLNDDGLIISAYAF